MQMMYQLSPSEVPTKYHWNIDDIRSTEEVQMIYR